MARSETTGAAIDDHHGRAMRLLRLVRDLAQFSGICAVFYAPWVLYMAS